MLTILKKENKNNEKKWQYQSEENSNYVGIVEFQDNNENYQSFEIINTPKNILFGSSCNTGFLQSGYYKKDKSLSFDENLQELLSDLKIYYNEGYNYTTDNFICNDRM